MVRFAFKANLRQTPGIAEHHTTETEFTGGAKAKFPDDAQEMTLPEHQQPDHLSFFKDFYSLQDIHPGDVVAVVWEHEPRAEDEFAIERGDMVHIVTIWDDAWATGIMTDERAIEWDTEGNTQQSDQGGNLPLPYGEIKVFPLVCVCLPSYWGKAMEGAEWKGKDSTEQKNILRKSSKSKRIEPISLLGRRSDGDIRLNMI